MKFNRIKKLRLKNNLNQEEIAKILKVKRSTYAEWELGTNIIPLRRLLTLSNYYKLNLDYIVGLTTNMDFTNKLYQIDILKIGNNLKSLRIQNNLTQKDIAKILKISVSSYTHYETGKILIPTKNIYLLCKKFKVSMDDLIKK